MTDNIIDFSEMPSYEDIIEIARHNPVVANIYKMYMIRYADDQEISYEQMLMMCVVALHKRDKQQQELLNDIVFRTGVPL